MKSQSRLKQHDSIQIPEGFYVEPYTPTVGGIISPALNKQLAYVKLWLNGDASGCSLRDAKGNAVTGINLKAGPCPFLVSEISSTGGITCYIIHDGVLAAVSVDDYTNGIYSQTAPKVGT